LILNNIIPTKTDKQCVCVCVDRLKHHYYVICFECLKVFDLNHLAKSIESTAFSLKLLELVRLMIFLSIVILVIGKLQTAV